MEAIDTAGSVELMERFVGKHYRDAAASILAGSRARGDARSTSDYDLVLLYETIPSAWRGMQEFEGAHVECFAHDPGTLQYFLDEIELPSAEPALARMVVEGSVVTGEGSLVLEKAHKAAATLLRNGPPSWTTPKIDAARYRITELAASLPDARDSQTVLAVGSALYQALGQFALGTAGHWIGSGKALAALLSEWNPHLARRLESAIQDLLAGRGAALIQEVVDEILLPCGGRLRAGFHQSAPADWRK